MSTNMRIEHLAGQPVETVRARLLDPAILTRFAERQHPQPGSVAVAVNSEAGTSQVSWTTHLSDDLEMPGIVQRLVGSKLFVDIRMRPDTAGTITVKVKARADASMKADLLLHAEDEKTRLIVDGPVSVHVPIVGGQLEHQAIDHFLKPILEEDLFPLLN